MVNNDVAQNNVAQYDAIIIGTGQGGYPLAKDLPKAGWKTAIIEKDAVGGSCVNSGCTPTKTMVASARVAYLARRGADYGVVAGPISVDLSVVRERKRNIVADFSGGSQKVLENTDGLDLIFGTASFVSSDTVEVQLRDGGQRRLRAKHIFINTGTRPAVPAIEGLDQVTTLDSAAIMELDEVPEHLLVLGGGYIGLEFGQMFRRFGSQVTVVQRGPQLTREDPDIAAEITKILEDEGIQVLLNTLAVSVMQPEAGRIELIVDGKNGPHTLNGSHLLLAAGRTPNSDMLNLEAAGVEQDKYGLIPVNERLETNVPGIYVIGDVKGGPAFTHISYDDYRVLRTNLLEGGNATITGRMVPYAMFIDPQLGRVGLSEREARAQGLNIKVAKIPMTWVARALEMDETRGLMKVVVDANSDLILGAAILGLEGGELMTMLQMAMLGGITASTLKDTIFAHPTLAESFNNLFASFES